MGDSQRKFAYAPADEALRRDVDELAAMYNERPVTSPLWPYGLRLLGFMLIIVAIIDKNRARRPA